MFEIELSELRDCACIGVAGNFAGHLEQAGEAEDFARVGDAGHPAPKGIFPIYIPGAASFLGVFPLSRDKLALPASTLPLNLQIEPEVGLLCDVAYAADGAVARLAPIAAGAFNDCSIRRPGAVKISEKKNWGADSEGFAGSLFSVTDLGADGPTKNLRLVCFLRRAGRTDAYGVDSPVAAYSYYGRRLLDWLVDRLNNQQGAPDTPLEPVGEYLAAAARPARMLVGIGATRYTPLGETTFLEAGDESIVVVYDGAANTRLEVEEAIGARRDGELVRASILRQTVYERAAS